MRAASRRLRLQLYVVVPLFPGTTAKDGRVAAAGEALAELEFVRCGGPENGGSWEAVLRRGHGGAEFATLTRPGVKCCGCSYVLGSAYSIYVHATGETFETTEKAATGGRACCSCRDADWSRDVLAGGRAEDAVGQIVRSNVRACRTERLLPPIRHPANGLCHFWCEDVFVPATFSAALPEEGPDAATLWFAGIVFSYVSSSAAYQDN